MTPQEEFRLRYVNTAEICERCEIDLSTLTQWRSKGRFPDPDIYVGKRVGIWERGNVEQVINRINLDRRLKA